MPLDTKALPLSRLILCQLGPIRLKKISSKQHKDLAGAQRSAQLATIAEERYWRRGTQTQTTKDHRKKTTMSGKAVLNSALRAAVNLQSSKIPTELAKSTSALLSSVSSNVSLPDLPYDYNALERKCGNVLSLYSASVILI